ncbi:MAG: cell division protein SepF [Anaerocolumna sp.]
MANIFKNILDSLKLTEDEDYDDYLSEEEEKARRAERVERKASKQQVRPIYERDESTSFVNSMLNETKKDKITRMERTSTNKVVPIRTTPKGFEVCIMKPSTFEDSQDICDMLLSGRAAVINLEGFDVDLAQRIMDFISGSVYAMNGKLHQISSYIFIISPDTVDISGDYLDLIQNDGFEVPTLNKEF